MSGDVGNLVCPGKAEVGRATNPPHSDVNDPEETASLI